MQRPLLALAALALVAGMPADWGRGRSRRQLGYYADNITHLANITVNATPPPPGSGAPAQAGLPTAVLFRTHLLDGTVLHLFSRLVEGLGAEYQHVTLLYDADMLGQAAVDEFVKRAGGGAAKGTVETAPFSFGTYLDGYPTLNALAKGAKGKGAHKLK